MEWPRLVSNGADESSGGDIEAFRRSLKMVGVRYVLWQSRGYGMRSERSLRRKQRSPAQRRYATSFLNLRALVAALEAKSTVLYKDKSVVLIDIGDK